ncbi:MAG: orotate phosphoribosyltransferase [Bacillota bacterium]|nr:orotate phosphoribosyltransferase [Bacillota bacterium]
MENKDKIIKLLKDTGVILEGHFLLTSGRHSNLFLQCSQLLQYPKETEAICSMMAEPYKRMKIDTVIGPAMGGVILAYESARQLDARAVYAEPSGDKMILRRGFQIGKGEKVLVVEDAVTTGGSVKKVLTLLESVGARVVGIAVMVDRTAGKLNFGLPYQALIEMEVESYQPEECPLCQKGILLEEPKGKPKDRG